MNLCRDVGNHILMMEMNMDLYTIGRTGVMVIFTKTLEDIVHGRTR